MDKILKDIETEYKRANTLYPAFHSNHEAYAVILEELDEVWSEVKQSKDIKGNKKIRAELIQVAAICVKYIKNLC